MNCPVCKSDDTYVLKNIIMAKTSYCLYNDIVTYQCNKCFHEFNEHNLSKDDFTNYYRKIYKQYFYTPSTNHIKYKIEEKTLLISQLDIDNYIDALMCFNNGYIKQSEVREVYDYIILDQFLEHCWDLDNVMINIGKISSDNCKLHITAPDTNDSYEHFDKLERLIKEHIHHFTETSIKKLLQQNDFMMSNYKYDEIELLNGKTRMSIIKVDAYKKKAGKIYCYGASRELLYLLGNNKELSESKISGVIEDTFNKIGMYIDDIPVINSDVINELDNNSVIYITAIYHKEKIKQKILDMGFKGMIRDDLTI